MANQTDCVTFDSRECPIGTNFTFCLSDGGHQWYGVDYDPAVCRWQGYEAADCDWEYNRELYGPNTLSISVATETFNFFDRCC